MNDITLSGASATIEATLRGFMVWVRDGSGRTIGEAYFPVSRPGNRSDAHAAYAAAAEYADSVGCRGPLFVTH